MSIPKIVAVAAALLLFPALVACEDPREFDLTQEPVLTLEEVTSDFVRISWGDDYADAQELRVERKKAGKRFKVVTKLTPNERDYTDDTVEDGRTYKYRLRAIFSNSSAHRSVILSVEVPEAPEAALVVLGTEDGKLSPDGEHLARVIEERVTITVLATGRRFLATRAELGPESDVAWMPDSRRLVIVAGEESALYLYDPGTGEGRLLALGAAAPEVSPDGGWLTFDRDGVTQPLPLPGALAPDGQRR